MKYAGHILNHRLTCTGDADYLHIFRCDIHFAPNRGSAKKLIVSAYGPYKRYKSSTWTHTYTLTHAHVTHAHTNTLDNAFGSTRSVYPLMVLRFEKEQVSVKAMW